MAVLPHFKLTSRSLRIFVVEDHEDTATYLCLYLELLGHSTACAGTMAQALEKLPRAGYDLILCDIQLPDGNGWDLLRQINAQLPLPTYAVAMSAWNSKDAHAISEAVGFHHHLDKPIKPLALDAVLHEAANALSDCPRSRAMLSHRRY